MLWVLFTFPSRYWFTIGLWRVFSLGGWARQIHAGFHVPRATQESAEMGQGLRVRGCHPLRPNFPERSACLGTFLGAVLQPPRRRNAAGLGYSPVARHYWGNHVLFSFPPATKMFQFAGLASPKKGMTGHQPDGLPHSEIRGSRVACT